MENKADIKELAPQKKFFNNLTNVVKTGTNSIKQKVIR